MGRHHDALADLNRAIGLSPEYAWAIASRGQTYRLMGRYDAALADLNRAIEGQRTAGIFRSTVDSIKEAVTSRRHDLFIRVSIWSAK